MNCKIIPWALMVGLLLVIAGSAAAQGFRDLSSEELKSLLEKRHQPIVVVDVRTEQEYRQGHISGAINISSTASNRFNRLADFLPDDKGTSLVFYCRGYT